MKKSFSRSPFASAALWLLFAAGCAGDGCSCMQPIPGGFPPEERVANAAQIRVSDTGLAAVESDPAALIGGLLGDGMGLEFDIPPACGSDDNPQICCDGNGQPMAECGPVIIDLDEQPGDAARLEVNPAQGASQIELVVRARVYTAMALPISYDTGLFTANCDATIDTRSSGNESLTLRATINLPQDATAGTTRIEVAATSVEDLDDGDIDLDGGFDCTVGSWFIGFFIDTLAGFIEDTISDMITEQVCKQCPSGDVDECGPFADSCTDNICMKADSTCLQELGIAGRLSGASLLGSFSPGTVGKLDLYEVAGGYASTNSNGVSLGMLGGALPAGAERERCGPPATQPAPVSVPVSSFFQGNTRPDTGAPFGFGFGMHQHNLDLLAWSAYDGGILCLNVGTRTVDLLTSDTLAILMPSLIDLLHGENAQLVLGLRPQSPPAMPLGLNTTTEVGGETVIDDPLLDISFDGLELDFYAMVDDQFIRVMTLRTDVNLPLNLEVDENGELLPVLGDLENAFTNIEVENSEALAETPEELADKFPAVLSLALPLLADGLGTFALPELGGLSIVVQPDGITSVEGETFLAIFGDLVVGPAAMAAPVHTEARLVARHVPSHEVFRARRLDRAQRPSFTFELGGTAADGTHAELEFSFRVNGGLWSPYTRSRQVTLDRDAFWLQGRHTIEIRAREVGRPETTDPTPVVFEPIVDTVPPEVVVTRPTADAVQVMATDNVSKKRLRMRYRLAGGDWAEAPVPAAIELGGQAPESLEIEVFDETGNARGVTGDGLTRPVVGFHGSGGEGGCECRSGQRPGAGGLLLCALTLLGLMGRTWRRRLAALARRAAPMLVLVIAAGMLPACNCGGTPGPSCENDECLEGEVERGPTGRWSSVAADSSRAVVSAYDETLGDLVVIDITADPYVYTAVDGVPPDVAPVYEPDTYRGGVTQPGPDVGGWTSIALAGGQARVAYQDRDNGALKYAAESDDGWQVHTVDPGAGHTAGLYTSIAIAPDGAPAIAYMATDIDDGSGAMSSELRYAKASSANPGGEGDWTITVIESAPSSCAGTCGSGLACVDDGTGQQCVVPTSDCNDSCGSDEVCSTGVCVVAVPEPTAHDLPHGSGLFADLVYLSDGRAAVVHYDRNLGDLVMHVDDGDWTRIDLHAGADSDTGMWASAAVDGSGTVHVAYQDALGDQLLYTSWAGGQVGPVEVVDDGVREGDRPHPVGASASVMVDGSGLVKIAYQDGATADLVLATRSGDSWERKDLLTGDLLHGFHVDAAAGATTYITSYMYDRALYPPGDLVVVTGE